jgi:hypothetical protein
MATDRSEARTTLSRKCTKLICEGYTEVMDADLSRCFGTRFRTRNPVLIS